MYTSIYIERVYCICGDFQLNSAEIIFLTKLQTAALQDNLTSTTLHTIYMLNFLITIPIFRSNNCGISLTRKDTRSSRCNALKRKFHEELREYDLGCLSDFR